MLRPRGRREHSTSKELKKLARVVSAQRQKQSVSKGRRGGRQRPHRTPGPEGRIWVFTSSGERPLGVLSREVMSAFAPLKRGSGRSENGRLVGATEALEK